MCNSIHFNAVRSMLYNFRCLSAFFSGLMDDMEYKCYTEWFDFLMAKNRPQLDLIGKKWFLAGLVKYMLVSENLVLLPIILLHCDFVLCVFFPFVFFFSLLLYSLPSHFP